MPNTPSAKKSLKTDRERRLRNRIRKSKNRSSEKRLLACIAAGDDAGARQAYRDCCSELDKSANAGTIHVNLVARKKSRLAARLAAIVPATTVASE